VSSRGLRFTILDGSFAVCRLDPRSAIPAWAKGEFVSVTRTAQELSIVCEQAHVPAGIRQEGDWRALKVAGPIAFSQCGVTVSFASPIAAAGVSLLPFATYDTDYFFVKADTLDRAIAALEAAGHRHER